MYNNRFNRTYGYYNNYNRQQPQISIQDSIQIAMSIISGQVIKTELEIENGILLYEVKIRTPQGIIYEIEEDASTGNVINVEIE